MFRSALLALSVSIATTAAAADLVYELEWRVVASVSRLERGTLRTVHGELTGVAQLVLHREEHGVLMLEWHGPEGSGSAMIGPGGPEHVTFPVPAEVGLPPAPPYRGGGTYRFRGARGEPEAFQLAWAEAFHCRTSPAACDNITAWERGFVGTARRVQRSVDAAHTRRLSSRRNLYSIESTSACHDASMMFSATPTVPHVSSPSPDVISTRVCAAVPFDSSRIRTL
jgi:hypothetical protein